jgi:hypothetical protein
MHIHGDCSVSRDSVLAQKDTLADVPTLFGVEEDAWRSIRPVLQNGQRRTSSPD